MYIRLGHKWPFGKVKKKSKERKRKAKARCGPSKGVLLLFPDPYDKIK